MKVENNRNKGISVVLVVLLVLVALGGVFFGTYQWQQYQVTGLKQDISKLQTELENAKKQAGASTDAYTYTSSKGVKIKVYYPTKDQTVSSPLVILGEVPGNWSFEASFPVVIKNSEDVVINQVAASVLGDWMTSNLVPFSATIDYDASAVGDGVLVLQKDNPSGLPENDDSVTIPLKFE